MKEKDFQTLFTKWLKERWHGTGAFELKLCKKKSLPFDAIKEHQINALKQVERGTFAYKISDFSPGMKPFDCFSLTKQGAYLAIMFYVPRQPKGFHLITVKEFNIMKKIAGRKSFTEDMIALFSSYFRL